MATKRQLAQELGKRVVGQSSGRQVEGVDYARGIARRVNAVRKHLGLTWEAFESRVGLSEKKRRLRMNANRPTPFAVAEIDAICDEFHVRADFLVRGLDPMFDGENAPTGPLTLAEALHRHIITVAAARVDAEPEGVAGFLPEAETLLVAVERGAVDAVGETFKRRIETSRLAGSALRAAVAPHIAAGWSPPDPPAADLSRAVRGLVDGTVLDLGRAADGSIEAAQPSGRSRRDPE